MAAVDGDGRAAEADGVEVGRAVHGHADVGRPLPQHPVDGARAVAEAGERHRGVLPPLEDAASAQRVVHHVLRVQERELVVLVGVAGHRVAHADLQHVEVLGMALRDGGERPVEAALLAARIGVRERVAVTHDHHDERLGPGVRAQVRLEEVAARLLAHGAALGIARLVAQRFVVRPRRLAAGAARAVAQLPQPSARLRGGGGLRCAGGSLGSRARRAAPAARPERGASRPRPPRAPRPTPPEPRAGRAGRCA